MTTNRPNSLKREVVYFEAAVRRALAEIPVIEECRAPIAKIAAIRYAVAKAFNVQVSDITGGSGWTVDRMARQAFMGMALRLTNDSLLKIAHYCGVKHTTVLWGNKRYKDVLDRIIGPNPERENEKQRIKTRMFEALGQLIQWSRHGAYAHYSDILPNDKSSRRLSSLRKKGFAESFRHRGEVAFYWRATDAGRAAYQAHLAEQEAERVAA